MGASPSDGFRATKEYDDDMADMGNLGALSRYADVTRELGSSFVASVLEAGERQLYHAPHTAALIAAWDGNSATAALAMRFNGALHALARQGHIDRLSALYRLEHDDFDGAIGGALAAEDDFVAKWMRDPPQTNEVGRAASILSALMVVRQETGLPVELLEIGSSGGLNLNLARYAYDLGGVAAGMPGSPVHIAPKWTGSPPPLETVEVVSARGVDLRPLDPSDDTMRDRLLSFVWADQRDRARRLQRALEVARMYPPRVEQGDAVVWLKQQLDLPQRAGLSRVVFHSMVLQYLTEPGRNAVIDMIAEAGSRATVERPLAWVSFEWTPTRSEVQLRLTCWPTGETRHLATCHPYGDWVAWRG
ncbi:hypothetical protein SAMN05444678_12247 [Sphingomonas sp. YR710]|uniref:DUF2332 domain-containing protein n=1 Tax=Sphingomonas sp. YR710 TaxID=1882773 RepID=UPI0008835C69|nr:DUF2332 family protein [Sphingomonas sp. YR710]SDD78803.1 hypothetical protein SAMN05444678_12247 [Sphingomonas sp. YR710]